MAVTVPNESASTLAAKRRLRFPDNFPLPAPTGEANPWKWENTPGLENHDLVAILAGSRAWKETMTPALAAVDTLAKGKRQYSSEELETVFTWAALQNIRQQKDIPSEFDKVDNRGALEALGIADRNDLVPWRAQRREISIPSQPTLSRHRKRLPVQHAVHLWRQVYYRQRDDLLTHPEMQEPLRILMLDGTDARCRGVAALPDAETGEIVNDHYTITADAGYVPPRGKNSGGHGYKLVTAVSGNVVPLDYAITRINTSELETARTRILDHYIRRIRPVLNKDDLRVIIADGLFAANSFRRPLHEAGLLEVIHEVSHGDQAKNRAKAFGAKRIPIDGYDSWFATGHRELVCKCGHNSVSHRAHLTGSGVVIPRLEGRCTTCGTITITAGQWTLRQNPARYAAANLYPDAEPDWSFGNPLTYNSLLAKAYGCDRFGRNEGFHSVLSKRFKIINLTTVWSSLPELELAVLMAYSVLLSTTLHVLNQNAALPLAA